MNIRLRRVPRQNGSVLLVTLFMALLLGMFLFYYLNLIHAQRGFVARSQAWNGSLGVAEAGVEEALAQLNPAAVVQSVDRAANGWGGPAGGMFGPVIRSLPGGTYSVYLTGDPMPIIYSTGFATNVALGAVVKRTVRVTTTTTPLFTVALGAKNGVDFKGNGTLTDSFDSTKANLSNTGLYYQPVASTNGDVASYAGIVNVGNGDINGSVLLGPTATNSIGSNGTITDGVRNDFNIDFWDVQVPQYNWLPAAATSPAQTIDGVTYNYVFNTPGNFTNVINGNLNGNIYVGTNTQVTLWMNGGANISNLRIAGGPAQAGQLILYADGATVSMFTVTNYYATNFVYLGSTNNTQVNFTGNATFTGVLYAPEAQVKLSGGGNSIINFIGSIIGDTVVVNGHYQFHYDESLLRRFMKGYIASSWQEL
jgi:Tfp pilus assembly protein PilX